MLGNVKIQPETLMGKAFEGTERYAPLEKTRAPEERSIRTKPGRRRGNRRKGKGPTEQSLAVSPAASFDDRMDCTKTFRFRIEHRDPRPR
jgi:hypothetical protein